MIKREMDEMFFADQVWVHYNHVLKFLYTLTTDKNLTEDLTQETMLCCWKKLEQIKKYGDLKAGVIKIAKNQFNQFLRTNQKMEQDICEPEKMKMFPFACVSNIEEFIKKEGDIHEFLLIFSGIKREYVRVVILADYYDFSLKEVASLLRKNYNTVVSYHARGLVEMRKRKDLFDKIRKGEFNYEDAMATLERR